MLAELFGPPSFYLCVPGHACRTFWSSQFLFVCARPCLQNFVVLPISIFVCQAMLAELFGPPNFYFCVPGHACRTFWSSQFLFLCARPCLQNFLVLPISIFVCQAMLAELFGPPNFYFCVPG